MGQPDNGKVEPDYENGDAVSFIFIIINSVIGKLFFSQSGGR